MSVYNGGRYLSESIESVLRQEGVDFEFIIVNDGSTDSSDEVIDRYASSDARIRVFHQPNQGLTKALIAGCKRAKAEIIARQDADDVSLPGRLLEQAKLLLSREDVGLVSSFANYVGPEGEYLGTITRSENSLIATHELLNKCLGPPAHGSVMFRKDLYERVGGYRPEFYFAQDSDLWLRMCEKSQIAYCQHVHYAMTISEANISSLNRSLQTKFGDFGRLSFRARSRGGSDVQYLEQARELTNGLVELKGKSSVAKKTSHTSAYFIGSQLAALNDPRAVHYLKRVILKRPWHVRAWYKLIRTQANLALTRHSISQ